MKRTPPPMLEQVERTYVRHRNRKLSYFAGCDYFRLSNHPKVREALSAGMKRYGLNVAASRLTTGNHFLYEKLEDELATFFAAESATLASNGYLPNVMVAQALAGEFSHALIDEKAHGSLADAARFLDCPVLKFKHCDPGDLSLQLRRFGGTQRQKEAVKPLVMTDGMFAHDGAIAPLRDYFAALPLEGMMLVDDAHGAGVLGATGQGSVAYAGVSRRRIIQTITLSKAFGVYGGAVLGSARLRSAILERSNVFAGNTPMPLPLAAAVMASLRLVTMDGPMRKRLRQNVARVKSSLLAAGFLVTNSPSPIIAFAPEDEETVERWKRKLLALGIHPPFIKYPGDYRDGYFRFALSSEHSRKQLDDLVEALLAAGPSRSERHNLKKGERI